MHTLFILPIHNSTLDCCYRYVSVICLILTDFRTLHINVYELFSTCYIGFLYIVVIMSIVIIDKPLPSLAYPLLFYLQVKLMIMHYWFLCWFISFLYNRFFHLLRSTFLLNSLKKLNTWVVYRTNTMHVALNFPSCSFTLHHLCLVFTYLMTSALLEILMASMLISWDSFYLGVFC